jgi:Spy/CpxP family protein refolding chaperone
MRGIHQRKRAYGFPRKFRVEARVSAELYLTLLETSKLKRRTISMITEDALWRYLSKISSSGNVIERLRYASSLVTQVVVTASKLPMKEIKGPVDVHQKEGRQGRRNELSDKTNAATDQVFDLAQSEKLAAENQLRASMYAVLARLATINELILKDAAEEEILAAITALRKEQNDFEDSTRELEARAKEKV